MMNLYRSFMYRFTKDKIFILTILINFIISILGAILMYFINNNEQLMANPTGRTSLLTSFHPTSNMGILIPILLYIILQREYSQHTLRNKIISGYTRLQVYSSYTLAAITIGIIFLFINMVMQLLIANVFFGYGVDFTLNEFFFVFKTLVLSCIVYCFYFSLVSILTHLFKLVGFVIYMVLIIGLELLNMFSLMSLKENIYEAIHLFNPVKVTAELILGNHSTNVILFSLITGIMYAFLISTAGYQIFRKADIK